MTGAGTVAANIGDDNRSQRKGETVMTRKWLRISALSPVAADRVHGTDIIFE